MRKASATIGALQIAIEIEIEIESEIEIDFCPKYTAILADFYMLSQTPPVVCALPLQPRTREAVSRRLFGVWG